MSADVSKVSPAGHQYFQSLARPQAQSRSLTSLVQVKSLQQSSSVVQPTKHVESTQNWKRTSLSATAYYILQEGDSSNKNIGSTHPELGRRGRERHADAFGRPAAVVRAPERGATLGVLAGPAGQAAACNGERTGSDEGREEEDR